MKHFNLQDIRQGFVPTREQVLKALTTGVVVLLCVLAALGVEIVLKKGTNEKTVVLAAVAETQASVPEASEPSETLAPSETEATTETAAATTVEATEETTETSTDETDTTTKSTTAATTTAATTQAITESDLQLAVYATAVLNVRSGPGTDYDVVKQVNPGDQIDVIAVTSNGWYKTYNGNYVSADLTTQTPPTPTPTPKPAATPTPAPKETAPAATSAAIDTSSGVSCKITFYGPQDNGDGSYSLSTATGATCTQGVTVAADWSVYPAGTVIYIENDPLGGDGYYTVQDKGSAVKGAMIDIFVEDTSQYSTCTRTVYLG